MTESHRSVLAKAIIFSYHAPPVLDHVVRALEVNGYSIMLLVTACGPNVALPTSACGKLGKQIADVSDSYSFPILAVKSISQAKATVLALNVDLGLCVGFPYRITNDLLGTHTIYVNLHPAPLPTLAGNMPFIWPILRPELYPIETYCCTAHYVSDNFDSDSIIKETRINIPDTRLDTYTATDVSTATQVAICSMVYEVVKLTKEGYKGREPKSLPSGYHEHGARLPTDEERTITRSMTVEEAMRIYRASFEGMMPFFRFDESQYQVARLRLLDRPLREKETKSLQNPPDFCFRKDSHLLQAYSDGHLLMDLRKL